LFNGGGDLRRAGARMNLGMLKYSCSTEDFLKLISHEVKMRLMSSPYSGIDDDKKPIPSRYDPSRELTELVNGTEMDDKDFKVLGTLRQVRKRANGKYLSLGVNIYPNPAEDDMFIGEDDVNTLLEINQAMVRRWGKKGYEEVQGNIIYSLVNQGVHPYFLGFHCIKSGDDEETARNAELVKDIFGPVILDEVNIVDSVGDIKYELRVIKAPIIELKYPPLHDSLIRCLDYEMNQRIARTLGSQE
ncbi:MAG: hypothetical protein ACMXX5_01025, partial [Candidatus Woesearchaeota archaeon]